MRRKRWPPYRRNTSLVHGSAASNGPWIDLKQPRLSPGRSKSMASNLTCTRLSSSSKNPRTSQALKVAYCPGSGRSSRRWRRKHGRYAAWRARSIARVRRDRFGLSYAERGDNSLRPHRLPKVRLQSARILLPIQQCPDLKCERCRRSACNPTDQSLHAQTRSQLKELTIRPRQDARIRPSIGNDSIQDDPR